MKVVIENIIASCRLEGLLDLERLKDGIEGAQYQPEVFSGLMFKQKDPHSSTFMLNDGTLRFHGLTSEEAMKAALGGFLSIPVVKDLGLRIKEPLKVDEIIASVDLGSPIDAKRVYEEFKDEGVIYDPSELPGFILKVGTSGIEVLIFPEGKLVIKGVKDLQDAISSLQMVKGRMEWKD